MTDYDPFNDINAWRRAADLLYRELNRAGMPLMCECNKKFATPEYRKWLENPESKIERLEQLPTPRLTGMCRSCLAKVAYERVAFTDEANSHLDEIELAVFGKITTHITEPVEWDG